ncbi:5-bromo-4-chloroindolyl phosphate hydrolysis family protein [Vallitalea sediminicola]
MDKRNFSSIGNEIKDSVKKAVNTRDFSQLNKDIGNTVNNTLDEIKSSIGYNNNSKNGNKWDNKDIYNERNKDRHYRYNHHSNNPPCEESQVYKNKNIPKDMKFVKPVGRISGILFTVFGSIGIALFGIAMIVMGILGNVLDNNLFYTILKGLTPLFIVSVFLTGKGGSIRKRLKRFNKYIIYTKNKNYCMIKELSNYTGLGKRFIIKDLRRMISLGMFPEGHIDDQKTCFMLNNDSYDQYLKLQENMKAEKSEKEKQTREKTKEANNDEIKNSELIKSIEEGKSYIRQIREANDVISGIEITKKLYQLENVTSKIFNYVEIHPEQLSDIQKFMDYYLPTTAKLLNAYRELDMQSSQGENICSAKMEIENTLDTINLAFENLLDSLFQDVAMDVATDISVLQTMLKQEGLTEKDFN